MKEVIPVI